MNIIDIGARKEGKTTLALWQLIQRHRAIVVFDPRGMINGLIVHNPEELEEAIEQVRQLSAEDRKQRVIVYRFDSTNYSEEFAAFCSVVFPPNFTLGGFGVLIDEAGRLQTANSIDPNLARAIGQHPFEGQCEPGHEVTIVQTMHTLGGSWAQGRSLINELCMFRLTAPSDVKAIIEYTGHPELVEIIQNLPQYHYVRFINDRQPQGQPEYFVVSDPRQWFNGAVTTGQKKDVDKSPAWVSDAVVRVI